MTIDQQRPLNSDFTASSTAEDILAGADFTGRTILVTGGYSGLGLATVRALADTGATVLVLARRREAADQALRGLAGVKVLEADLADLGSIGRCAEEIAAQTDGIDVLIAAAGVMATPQRPVGPGWDYQLAINHFGHFALTMRLFPLLAKCGARVVAYSSSAHHHSGIRWDDMHFRNDYDGWTAYGQSKTANVLFAHHLDHLAHQEGVRAFSVHPGKIITELQRDLSAQEQVDLGWIDSDGNVIGEDFKTPSQGAATGLWAATSPLLDGLGGLYLEDCDVATLATPEGSMDGGVQPYALDPESAERLWEITAAVTATGLPRRR